MTVSKCIRCGANIPPGAAFCPSCGAPKAVEQPTTQQAQPVYYPTQTGSIENVFDTFFSTKLIVLGVLFGLLIVWIGNILFTFIFPPTTVDYTGIRVATFLNAFGLFVMGSFLIGGGISNKILDKFVRLGMIIGGAWLVGTSLVVSYPGLLGTIIGAFP